MFSEIERTNTLVSERHEPAWPDIQHIYAVCQRLSVNEFSVLRLAAYQIGNLPNQRLTIINSLMMFMVLKVWGSKKHLMKSINELGSNKS